MKNNKIDLRQKAPVNKPLVNKIQKERIESTTNKVPSFDEQAFKSAEKKLQQSLEQLIIFFNTFTLKENRDAIYKDKLDAQLEDLQYSVLGMNDASMGQGTLVLCLSLMRLAVKQKHQIDSLVEDIENLKNK